MSINDWNREEPKCIPANFRCDGRSSKSYFVHNEKYIYKYLSIYMEIYQVTYGAVFEPNLREAILRQ